MKNVISLCIMAATIGAVPLVYSAPGGGTQVMQYKSTSDYAYGYNCDGDVCAYFSAQSWDDHKGVAQGWVQVEVYDYIAGVGAYIGCSGPEYAGAVSVNQGNGNSTVNATLDPLAPSCWSDNVGEPLAVSLSGQPDGNYSNSRRGTGTQKYGGTTWKYNYQRSDFSEAFTGSNGFVDGTFSGWAEATRYNNRQRVK